MNGSGGVGPGAVVEVVGTVLPWCLSVVEDALVGGDVTDVGGTRLIDVVDCGTVTGVVDVVVCGTVVAAIVLDVVGGSVVDVDDVVVGYVVVVAYVVVGYVVVAGDHVVVVA